MLDRHMQGKFFHRAVEAGGVLYLSGMTADDRSEGMGGQTRQVLRKVDRLLTELGSDRSKVVMATAYITDMDAKDQMNEAWLEFFPGEHLPARATIGVASLGEGILIEVVCVAVR
jgi:enamine deaminase RidA (YjgF/YER057c/UK114 family)